MQSKDWLDFLHYAFPQGFTAPGDASRLDTKPSVATAPQLSLPKHKTLFGERFLNPPSKVGGVPLDRKERLLTQPRVSPEFKLRYPLDANLYELVVRSNAPNYRGARVRVPSALNLPLWDRVLEGFHDKDLPSFLRYGFPIGFEGDEPPIRMRQNHESATNFPDAVKAYVTKEATYGAMKGPFVTDPFIDWFHQSPLMTRAKNGSLKRRLIFNLSAPFGFSVNDAVPEGSLDGVPRRVTLPGAHDFGLLMASKGAGSWVFSVDISRAYRWLPADPRDWPLMGFGVGEDAWMDQCVQFGSRNGALCCSLVTSSVCHFLHTYLGTEVLVFLDDFAGSETTELEAWDTYMSLLKTLLSLGLEVAPDKCVPPTQSLTWIGVTYDTNALTMRIDPIKVEQTLAEVEEILTTPRALSKVELASLIGKLFHSIKCAKPARAFLNTLLEDARTAERLGQVILSPETLTDLFWLRNFLANANLHHLLRPARPVITLQVDACPSGIGALLGSAEAYSLQFPEWFRELNFHINCLEGLNIVLALRVWAKQLAHHTIVLQTDNTTAFYAIRDFRTRDRLLRDTARETALICASFDIDLQLEHVPGVTLTETADCLSRAHLGSPHQDRVAQLLNTGVTLLPTNRISFSPPPRY